MDKRSINWEAPEFVYHKKTAAWYWLSIIISLACLAFAVFTQNFLFAVFVVLAEILLIVWSREMPRMLEFSVAENGVKVGENNFYPVEDLMHFSVLDTRHGPELILRHKHKLKEYIKIPLPIDTNHTENITGFMREILPQKEHEESLPDSLFHLIRF